jgi:hypothetical protein
LLKHCVRHCWRYKKEGKKVEFTSEGMNARSGGLDDTGKKRALSSVSFPSGRRGWPLLWEGLIFTKYTAANKPGAHSCPGNP